jgi:hypothetical protein
MGRLTIYSIPSEGMIETGPICVRPGEMCCPWNSGDLLGVD